MTALKAWVSSNLFKIIMAAVLIVVVVTTLKLKVEEMTPAITANAQAIEKVEEEVEAVEKEMITMQASVDALGVRQETLHGMTDKKLDKIMNAVEAINVERP